MVDDINDPWWAEWQRRVAGLTPGEVASMGNPVDDPAAAGPGAEEYQHLKEEQAKAAALVRTFRACPEVVRGALLELLAEEVGALVGELLRERRR